MLSDIGKNLKTIAGWAGATISTDTTTTSTTVIDRLDFEAVLFAVHSGTITDGAYVLKILETDNSDGTTGAAEVGAYLVQEAFALSEDNTVQKVAAKPSKRYCTLSIVSTATTSGGVFKGAVAILGGVKDSILSA